MEKTYIKIKYKGRLSKKYKTENFKGAEFVFKGKTKKKYDKKVCDTLIKDALDNKITIKGKLNTYRIYDENFLLKEKKKLDSLNRTIKRKKLVMTLTVSSIALGLISYGIGSKSKKEAPIETTTSVSASTNETNEEEEIKYVISHEGTNEEDRSAYKNIKNKYILPIAEYSHIYGLDTNLVLAVLTQENKNEVKNDSLTGGHGLAQIESIWQGETIEAYNFVKKEYEVSDPIDVFRCDEDPNYCIKIACMILNNYYNEIHNKYSNKFTPNEEIQATLMAYNKGIGTAEEQIARSKNFEEFCKNMIGTPGGDDEYLHHVLSFVYNDEVIKMKTDDNNEYTIQIINTANDAVKNTDKENNYVEDDYIPSEGNSYIKRPRK